MSPLDDELRAALHGRAQVLTPSPDPLVGIEKRARRMRRNRAGAAVAGSALAVAMIAVAVPAVQNATSGTGPRGPVVAAGGPSSEQHTTDSAAYALDPRDPWRFRGTPVSDDDRAMIQREYATRTGGADVLVTPLYAGLGESAARTEVVFLADVDGGNRWGVASYPTEAGLEIVWDEALPEPALVLAAALPGDDAPRLVVVASPDAGSLQYGPDDAGEFSDMTPVQPGVAVIALEGDPAGDVYRLLDAAGSEVYRAPAPDPAPGTGDPRQPQPADAPDNLLDWGFRGQEDPELEERAVQAYAEAKGVAPSDVGWIVLFSGDNDPGQRFTVLQMWTPGRPAQVVGFVDHTERGDELVLQPLTDPDEPVVALLLTRTPGRTFDELVVIPTPATGQVLYAADAQAEPRPVEPAPGLDGVVLIERELGADDDRLTVLDGDGDMDHPLYDGRVADLLCGETGCR